MYNPVFNQSILIDSNVVDRYRDVVMDLSSLSEKACPQALRPMLDRLKGSPIGRRIVGNSFWSVAGSGTAKAFVLLALLLTARLLGKELNGQFGFIRATALAFVAFSSFGIGIAMTKHIAELFQTDRERTARIIGLGFGFSFISAFLVATLFWFAAPWLCEERLHAPHLLVDMRIGAVLLFFITFVSAQVGVMMGFQDFRGLAMTNFITGIAAVPLYAGGTYFGGLRGALLGLLVATFLNVTANSMFIFRNMKRYDIRYSFRGVYREIPLLWSYGLPTVISTVLLSLSTWFCQLTLASQPDGSGESGLYFAAMIFYPVILFLPEQVAAVLLPTLCEMNAQGDAKRYRQTVLYFIFFGLVSTLTLALPLALFSKQVMGLCGSEYETGAMTLVVICATAVVYMIGHTANIVVVSRGKMWFMVTYFVVGVASMMLVSLMLINSGRGALGLALGMLAGFSARLLLVVPYVIVHVATVTNPKHERNA